MLSAKRLLLSGVVLSFCPVSPRGSKLVIYASRQIERLIVLTGLSFRIKFSPTVWTTGSSLVSSWEPIVPTSALIPRTLDARVSLLFQCLRSAAPSAWECSDTSLSAFVLAIVVQEQRLGRRGTENAFNKQRCRGRTTETN